MMAILDRYFTQMIAKPGVYSTTTIYSFGYFDTRDELRAMLCAIGKKLSGMQDLHIRIQDSKTILEDVHFPLQKRKGSLEERFNFTSDQEVKLFINKYFDISDIDQVHQHYIAEFRLDYATTNVVILGYFGSVAELLHILTEVGKKIKEDGNFSLTIDRVQVRERHMLSKSYKMYRDGSLLVPEMDTHMINLRENKDLKNFSLFLEEQFS